MKKRCIWLLLFFAGVAVIVFFLLADLMVPQPSLDDQAQNGFLNDSVSANDSFVNTSSASEIKEIGQDAGIPSKRIPVSSPTLYHRDEIDVEEAEEFVEAQEEVEELFEQGEAEKEEAGLDPEKEKALNWILAKITLQNWREARAVLLAGYKDGTIPQNPYVENELWSKVGEVGGQKVANELLSDADPAYSKILGGWGRANPQALLDYFAEVDQDDPQIQKYLVKTHNRELPLFDQFSSGILDGLLNRDAAGVIADAQLADVNKIIEHFLENDPMKGESLMREFTERVIDDLDLDALKEWVSGYEEPELQSATAQRVIESGAFDEAPLEAVDFAHSLSNEKAKRTGLSSAYARLASGVNGHDPNLTAQELNAMKDGMERDFALNGFAHGLVHSDPEAALQWANSISNENFRKVVARNIARRIKRELPRSPGAEE